MNHSKDMVEEEIIIASNIDGEFKGFPSINNKENKNVFIDRKISHTKLFPFPNASQTRRMSMLQTPQELLLNKQAKKLFEIGQGGLSLPSLSYLSTKVHSPSQNRDSIKLASQIVGQKAFNEQSQESLSKQFPLFQNTNVNEFDNQIDFFSKIENLDEEKEDQKKLKSQMKVNFTNKRRKDSIMVDMIQLAGKNTFIQPQFMQERGSMCITELWPESMKKELVKSHTQSHKKIQNVQNLRMHNSDKSFMSIFRPEKQKQSVDVYQSVKDNNSHMELSKFSEKNVIGVFGLMNENRTNKILIKQRSFAINNQTQSGHQTPQSNEDSVIENTYTPKVQNKSLNGHLKSPKSNFYNKQFFPPTPKSKQLSLDFQQKNLNQQHPNDIIKNSDNIPSPPKKQSQSNISLANQSRNLQNNDLNSYSLYIKNSQNIIKCKNKLDLLKNECEEELENNLQIEKSINTNLKNINNKLSTLLTRLS